MQFFFYKRKVSKVLSEALWEYEIDAAVRDSDEIHWNIPLGFYHYELFTAKMSKAP